MICFRISNHKDLTGLGAELADGRWHTGNMDGGWCIARNLYRSPYLNPSFSFDLYQRLPEKFQLLSIEIPDTSIERPDLSSLDLSQSAQSYASTRAVGDEWLDARRSLATLVPSVVVPMSMNLLINSKHPDMRTAKIIGDSEIPTGLATSPVARQIVRLKANSNSQLAFYRDATNVRVRAYVRVRA